MSGRHWDEECKEWFEFVKNFNRIIGSPVGSRIIVKSLKWGHSRGQFD